MLPAHPYATLVILNFFQQGKKFLAKKLMLHGRKRRHGSRSGWFPGHEPFRPSQIPVCMDLKYPCRDFWLYFWFQPRWERPGDRICAGHVHKRVIWRLSWPMVAWTTKATDSAVTDSDLLPSPTPKASWENINDHSRALLLHNFSVKTAADSQGSSDFLFFFSFFWVGGCQPKDASGKDEQPILPDLYEYGKAEVGKLYILKMPWCVIILNFYQGTWAAQKSSGCAAQTESGSEPQCQTH